jgi:hypothetical protein
LFMLIVAGSPEVHGKERTVVTERRIETLTGLGA